MKKFKIWVSYGFLISSTSQIKRLPYQFYDALYTHRNELPHGKLNGTCENQKLSISLEPKFRLLPGQSGSCR